MPVDRRELSGEKAHPQKQRSEEFENIKVLVEGIEHLPSRQRQERPSDWTWTSHWPGPSPVLSVEWEEPALFIISYKAEYFPPPPWTGSPCSWHKLQRIWQPLPRQPGQPVSPSKIVHGISVPISWIVLITWLLKSGLNILRRLTVSQAQGRMASPLARRDKVEDHRLHKRDIKMKINLIFTFPVVQGQRCSGDLLATRDQQRSWRTSRWKSRGWQYFEHGRQTED